MNFKKRLALKYVLPCLFLAACSSTPTVSSVKTENKAVCITVHHSALHLSLPANYRWSSGFLQQSAHGTLQNLSMQRLLKQSIEREMKRKGYQLVDDKQPVDLIIRFTAALSSTLNDNDIQRLYGLVPGLLIGKAKPQPYEKGTVIFDVIDTKTHQLAWRTAGLALATIVELPIAERKERINNFVKKLLAFLPEKE